MLQSLVSVNFNKACSANMYRSLEFKTYSLDPHGVGTLSAHPLALYRMSPLFLDPWNVSQIPWTLLIVHHELAQIWESFRLYRQLLMSHQGAMLNQNFSHFT